MMDLYLEMLLPALALPVALSLAGLAVFRRYPAASWLLPLIWLPSCFWLSGWPRGWPSEAKGWLWLLLVASLLIQAGAARYPRWTALAQAGLLGVALAISAGGLALVTALAGSLLIGQLAGALAASLAALALYEIRQRRAAPVAGIARLVPLLLVYLALLAIARLYASIPLASAALLLVAVLTGVRSSSPHAALFSLSSVLAALTWLLFTADAASDY